MADIDDMQRSSQPWANGDAPNPPKRRKTTNVSVKDAPKFDLESYISNYEGRTRLDRLRTIGISSKALGPEALRLGAREASMGKDADTYRDFITLYKDTQPHGHDAMELDDSVAAKIEGNVARETDRMTNDLKGSKNNLIRESIRLGNDDMGQHYYRSGQLREAYNTFHQMRDYCLLSKHVAEMYLKLILTGAAQENWLIVQRDMAKLRNLTLKPEDKTKIDPFLEPIVGLSYMCQGSFNEAARSFLQADPAFSTLEAVAKVKPNTEILTPNDIATYGGLCALASLSRTELERNVLNNENFRSFLELESHLRRAIVAFCSSKYTQCLEILESYRNDYLLDIHLQPHVNALYAAIRRKSIIAYAAPFSQVSIASMAEAFNVDAKHMENELLEIIKAKDLDARLDLVDMLLVPKQEHEREALQEKALKMAREHEMDLRLRLYRINMMQAGFEVKSQKKGQDNGYEQQGSGMGLRVGKGR